MNILLKMFVMSFLVLTVWIMYEVFAFFCLPYIRSRVAAYKELKEAERIVREKEKENIKAKAKALEVQEVEVEDCGKVSWHVHNGKQRGEHIVSTKLIIKAARLP